MRALALLDTLLFSSLWTAAAAAALAWAAASALAVPDAPLLLVFTGTFVVYNIDRLRDLARDRTDWPQRSGFVGRYRNALSAATALAALIAFGLAWRAGPEIGLLCVAAVIPGLFHRRMKERAGFKVFYVALAWVAVTVGFPALSATLSDNARTAVPWVAAVYGCCLIANAMASDLREQPASQSALRLARALALAGLLLALTGPERIVPLAAVALFQLTALIRVQSSERYRLGVIDGSLLAGALLAQLAYAAAIG